MKKFFLHLIFSCTTFLQGNDLPLEQNETKNHLPECSLKNVTVREIIGANDQGWLLFAKKAQWYSPLKRIIGHEVSIDFLFNSLTCHVIASKLLINTATKDVYINTPFSARCDEAEIHGTELFYAFDKGTLFFSQPITCTYPTVTIHAGKGEVNIRDQSLVCSEGVRTEFLIPFEQLRTR